MKSIALSFTTDVDGTQMSNSITIECDDVGPQYDAVTPTLELRLRLSSRDRSIEVLPFQYAFYLAPPSLNVRHYLGRGTAGEKVLSVSRGGSAHFRSSFELGLVAQRMKG